MKDKINRREFLRSAAFASTMLPLSMFPSRVFSREHPATGDIPVDTPGLLALWYDKPAAQWVEALPIGNGRLGAMVFGGTENERLHAPTESLRDTRRRKLSTFWSFESLGSITETVKGLLNAIRCR